MQCDWIIRIHDHSCGFNTPNSRRWDDIRGVDVPQHVMLASWIIAQVPVQWQIWEGNKLLLSGQERKRWVSQTLFSAPLWVWTARRKPRRHKISLWRLEAEFQCFKFGVSSQSFPNDDIISKVDVQSELFQPSAPVENPAVFGVKTRNDCYALQNLRCTRGHCRCWLGQCFVLCQLTQTPVLLRFHLFQLVQDFFHQQYCLFFSSWLCDFSLFLLLLLFFFFFFFFLFSSEFWLRRCTACPTAPLKKTCFFCMLMHLLLDNINIQYCMSISLNFGCTGVRRKNVSECPFQGFLYRYRFDAGDAKSPLGQFRLPPAPSQPLHRLDYAIFSCANRRENLATTAVAAFYVHHSY